MARHEPKHAGGPGRKCRCQAVAHVNETHNGVNVTNAAVRGFSSVHVFRPIHLLISGTFFVKANLHLSQFIFFQSISDLGLFEVCFNVVMSKMDLRLLAGTDSTCKFRALEQKDDN